jgi:hypothetical protein
MVPPELKNHFDRVVQLRNELEPIKGPRPEDKLAQLTSLLADVSASDSYKDVFSTTQTLMGAYLASEAGFPLILNTYQKMTEAQQCSWLQNQVDKLAEIQSLCGVKIKPAIVTPVHRGKKGDYATLGFDPNYDGVESQNLYLNMDAPDTATCPIAALATAMHEQWHQFDNTLAREVKFGRITPGHPLYSEGKYFQQQWENLAFVKFYPAYNYQLDERFATAFGNAVNNFLQAFRDNLNIQPIPGSLTEIQQPALV